MDRKMIKDFPEQEFIGGGEESLDICRRMQYVIKMLLPHPINL
jgi:hypothetical protein